MLTTILAVALTIAQLLAFQAIVISAFYALIEVFYHITESGLYRKIMLFIKQKCGLVKPVVVTIDRSGRIKLHETGRNVEDKVCPKEIHDALRVAERQNSCINGNPAIKWTPSARDIEAFRNACNS